MAITVARWEQKVWRSMCLLPVTSSPARFWAAFIQVVRVCFEVETPSSRYSSHGPTRWRWLFSGSSSFLVIGIDLSKVRLSHYALRGHGVALMLLPQGQSQKLEPLTEAGSGSVQDKEKARLAAIIEKVNELFEGELTDQDRLVYVDTVIKMKLLESKTLLEQATSNTKEQFATSPDLDSELLTAVMAALDAHNTMSTQALNSDKVRAGLKDILLNYAGLWEALRAKSA